MAASTKLTRLGTALLCICLAAQTAHGSSRWRFMKAKQGDSVKAGYWPYWASSYSPISSLKSDIFTHILFAFVGLNDTTFELTVPSAAMQTLPSFTTDVHRRNPALKTLLSIGGANASSATFAAMCATADTRRSFINSSIAVAREYGFDGLDLDWESPRTDSEMSLFGQLLSEWRQAVDSEAAKTRKPALLLTAAVYYASSFILSANKRAFPVKIMAVTLDWVNVMNYDYHGSWDTSATGTVAALYDPSSNISTSFGISSWLSAGMPASKVVMGMPLYGRSWVLKNPDNDTSIGAAAVAAGPKQELSDESGVMFYSEIVEFIAKKNATEVYDSTTVSAYAYKDDLWVSYDNPRSVSVKVEFAKKKSLRGYFFWSLNQDYRWTLCSTAARTWNKL